MAQQFVDGFDNYTVISNIWEASNLITGMASSNLRFANPPGCVSQYLAINSSGWALKNLSSNFATLIMGVAFNLATLPSTGVATLIGCDDASTTQVQISISTTGALQFYRGGSGSASPGTAIGSATSPGTIAPLVWYGLIIVVTIDPSAGAATAYLNGNATPVINGTGLNTRATANSFANQVLIGPKNNNSVPTSSLWDDVFCWDTSGSTQNAWPGNDHRVLTKMPTGPGDYTNWTHNGAATNWQCNNSIPPNIADYVSNNTPGTKDSYVTTPAGLTVNPYSVAVRQSIYKDDGNTHTAQALVRSSSVDAVGTAFNVNGSPTFVDTVFPNDPNTSAPWTGPAADATQIGAVETS